MLFLAGYTRLGTVVCLFTVSFLRLLADDLRKAVREAVPPGRIPTIDAHFSSDMVRADVARQMLNGD